MVHWAVTVKGSAKILPRARSGSHDTSLNAALVFFESRNRTWHRRTT